MEKKIGVKNLSGKDIRVMLFPAGDYSFVIAAKNTPLRGEVIPPRKEAWFLPSMDSYTAHDTFTLKVYSYGTGVTSKELTYCTAWRGKQYVFRGGLL